ncbi:hypothetical protein LSH36_253g02047 [Paralvinella palmiformis]|uniref:Uncharacterized protein n=1 Tax=Paralvinella palmiformis TaxID=53620 RepID=A0AAD9JL12_9ANNE|nr:hypothetical protein LSH36_253g02047 [Paralvinella palmiformis]
MNSKRQSENFCINEYDAVGFDLDGCLLKYKWNAFFELLHHYLTTYLTKVKHYDPSHIQPFNDGWKEVMFRGFFVDTKRGNLLLVLGDGTIERAFHGKVSLSCDRITSIYPDAKLPVFEQILKNFVSADEYHMIDNYFEGPLVMIFTDLITTIDNKVCKQQAQLSVMKSLDTGITYQKVWDDIFSGYLDFFDPEPTDMASRFIEISVNPAPYGIPCSRHLKNWLKCLKAANKCVFLMTSSTVTFAKGILHYILGEDYNDYFDFGIGRAGKPSFFSCYRKFVDVDDRQAVVTKIEAKKWYEFGCFGIFTGLLGTFTGMTKPKVLYIGDSIKNDAFPASRVAHWGALLILEAMEVEGCESPDPEKNNCHCKIVDDEDALYVGSNPVWGSFFLNNGKDTLFARVVKEASDVAIPWLDYISGKSLFPIKCG